MDQIPKFQTESPENWFAFGQLTATNKEKRQYYEDKAFRGVLSPEQTIVFLYGLAHKDTESYFENRKTHFDRINSFLFSFIKSRRVQEAEYLNNLGSADSLLSDECEYLERNILTKSVGLQYKKDLGAVLFDMDELSKPNYKIIKEMNDASKEKIAVIGRELFELYAGFDTNEDYANPGLLWLQYNNSREGINDLKRTAEEIRMGAKAFPYASEFLDKHISLPAKKFMKNVDIDDALIVKYISGLNQSPPNPFL